MVHFYCSVWPLAEIQGYTTPGWYFWDESWAFMVGPYDNQEEAQKKSVQYYHELRA